MAMLTTPRSALRTINEDQDSIRAMKNQQARKPGTNAPLANIFKKPSQPLQTLNIGNGKDHLYIHNDPVPKSKTKTKERIVTRAPEPLPEKEHMKIFDPNEDVKAPKHDKALIGVVERIRNWRPPCLFGAGRPDSDIDDSDGEEPEPTYEEKKQKLAEIFPPPETDPFQDEELGNLSGMRIPIIDIDDLPIPYLDDSIDIEPNMGTLEIWGSSTPMSLSPCSARDESSLKDSPRHNNSDLC